MFGIVWGLAIVGTIFKAFFVKKYLFTSTILYIAMGWMVILGWNQIIESLPGNGVILFVAGGIFYTVGAVFYMWRGFQYHHAVWHLLVMAGTASHFSSVFLSFLSLTCFITQFKWV